MSISITSTIVSHTTLANLDGSSVHLELFTGSGPGYKKPSLLEAMFTGYLMLQGNAASDLNRYSSDDRRVIVNYSESGSGKINEGEVWLKGDKFFFGETFKLSLEMLQTILRPFDLPVVELVRHIEEFTTEINGVPAIMLEDLSGYYGGCESDIWVHYGNKLLAFEQISGDKYDIVAAFELGKTWTGEEIKNNEDFTAIHKWVESV